MDRVHFEGWENCIEIIGEEFRLVVTTAVGPRVVYLGREGGPNMMGLEEQSKGKCGGDEWRNYGGHRLWVAPESQELTYEADNTAVKVSMEDGWVVFEPDLGASQIQKRMSFRNGGQGGIVVDHRLTNCGNVAVDIAPWALSVMAAGGECLIPQAEFRPHPEALLPARPVAIWAYTSMSDPRLTWGEKVLRFRQDRERSSCKFGTLVEQGYAAYALEGDVFLKRFDYVKGGRYLDFGCNFESYSCEWMLEVEALGTQGLVEPGESVSLRETWYLVPGQEVPEDDGACGDWLAELAADRPLITD